MLRGRSIHHRFVREIRMALVRGIRDALIRGIRNTLVRGIHRNARIREIRDMLPLVCQRRFYGQCRRT
jgi:hypothetical protein